MATQGNPLLMLYCPTCREQVEAAAASSVACPRCGRPRLRLSGANWANRSSNSLVAEYGPQVRYMPTTRPAAVDATVRNVQITALR